MIATFKSLALTACAIAGVFGLPILGHSQSADDFYRDKKEIYLVTSSAAGGGYDQYSRLVARHMPKYLPGHPAIVVQNMIGGGGIRAANYMYNVAPNDGSVFCLIDRGMPTAPLLYGARSKAQFEAVRFSWIGSLMQETGMGVLSARSAVRSIEDARHHEIFFGSTGPETDPAMFVRLVDDLLGTKIKVINGYKGQPEEFLSVEKGELDGLFMSGWSGPGRAYVRDRIGGGQMRLLVYMAPQRDPLYPDTPAILDLVSAGEDRQIVELVLNRMTLGRPFIAPPAVPADRLALLRRAFRQTAEDPEFRADAERQKLALNPTWGDAADAVIRELYRTPAPVVERMRRVVGLTAE
ncbi:MAG TPA: tripartite tricarboxylate transporter substrate-binding protein [Xanthobacteraceae bacterium]